MAYNGVPFSLPPWATPYPVFLPPHEVANEPPAIYGIAYDLNTRNVQGALPDGWAVWPSTVYREIKNHLMTLGFERHQYSMWQQHCLAGDAWNAMLDLRDIRPRGIFVTVARRVQIYRVPLPHLFIATDNIQLGGNLAPALAGPTPAGLAQGMGEVPPEHWPNGVNDRLPHGVRANLFGSLDPNNWRL